MTTRLTLILVAALAFAPIVFAQSCHVHLGPVTGWMNDRADGAQIDMLDGRDGTECVVIGTNLLRPHRDVANNVAPWNRPIGLAAGGHVACMHTASEGL